jgi:hypothetical protein
MKRVGSVTACRAQGWCRRLLRDESGQMIPEVILVVPVFLVALVLVVNVGMFIAEAARFDRITNEVARAVITDPLDPALRAEPLLQESLGYAQGGATGGSRSPFQASVDVSSEHEPFFEKRVLTFHLRYRLFGTAAIAGSGSAGGSAGGSGSGLFTRSKTLVVFWSRGL